MLKIQELAGASPPAPPPELCPGPAGGLTAPPRPPAVHFKTLSPRMLQSYKRAGSAPAQHIDYVDILNISLDLSSIYFAHFSGCSASFVYSCNNILECCHVYNDPTYVINHSV